MVKLIARSPCEGLLPLEIGTVSLREITPEAILCVAPFKGRAQSASDEMTAACGVGFPPPNRMRVKGDVQAVWSGRDQALVLGPVLERLSTLKDAAVSDHSDAWAVVELAGAGACDTLARLCPVDTRAMKRGHTARTLLQHLAVSLSCVGKNRFQIMAPRSMAVTLVHDLERAMTGVAARG